MTSKGHAKALVLKPMRKQAVMTSKGHATALVIKTMLKQTDMTSKGYAKALIHKPNEETSKHDLQRACNGARPQTHWGNK